MFHLMANTLATGGAVALTDVPAVTDGQFSIRNGHFIFSEQYNLLSLAAFGATVTALQSNTPHINFVNPHQVYPPNLSVTVPANVQTQDMRHMPMPLPMNEEIAWQASDSASENVRLFSWVGTPGWSMRLPSGIMRTTAIFTASVTTVAGAWSGDTNITQATQLRGGTYAILGVQCVAAATLAFRINFPRRPLINGRKTLPGDLAAQSYALVPNKAGPQWMGLWGHFNTFELPLLEVFANASATVTHTLYVDLLYLSEQTSALDSYMQAA